MPKVHIYDLQIRAIPDETLSSAVLEVKTDVWGNGKVKITLSKDGVSVMEDEKALSGKNYFTWEVENPILWSAEDPQLYDLSLEVYDESGNLQEVIPEKVGFRRFEMKNGIMTLNGKRIVFKGVNRHGFSSVSGRHVSDQGFDMNIMITFLRDLQKHLRIPSGRGVRNMVSCLRGT